MRFIEPERTAAVIFGAQWWPWVPRLSGGSAFAQSAADMKGYLVSANGLGLREDQDVLDLFDSDESAADQLIQLGKFLRAWKHRAGGEATSLTTLFIYYVGHGDFVGATTEFFLLVKQSRPANQRTCLHARTLADCLRNEAPLVRQVMVLDCCFSGAAQRVWMSSRAPHVAAGRTVEAMPQNGTVLLCSAAENMPSMAPRGSVRTMFTAALLDALSSGSTAIQGDISPRQARDLAFSIMSAQWGNAAVRPVLHAVDRELGDLSDLPLFPNPAYRAALAGTAGANDLVGLPGFRKITRKLADRSGQSLLSSARTLSAALLAAAVVVFWLAVGIFALLFHIRTHWVVRTLALPAWPSFILAFLFVLSLLNLGIVWNSDRARRARRQKRSNSTVDTNPTPAMRSTTEAT
jgi:Caspase domain